MGTARPQCTLLCNRYLVKKDLEGIRGALGPNAASTSAVSKQAIQIRLAATCCSIEIAPRLREPSNTWYLCHSQSFS
jgi:hypothetical protein